MRFSVRTNQAESKINDTMLLIRTFRISFSCAFFIIHVFYHGILRQLDHIEIELHQRHERNTKVHIDFFLLIIKK